VPVICVAKAGWNPEQLQARAKDSLDKHGGLDPEAFGTLWMRTSGCSETACTGTPRCSRERLRRRGVANRRSGAEGRHARLRIRAGHLETKRSRFERLVALAPTGIGRQRSDTPASMRAVALLRWQTHGPDRNGRTPRISLGHEVRSGRARYAVGGAHSRSGDG
jgi:hypothetical protein